MKPAGTYTHPIVGHLLVAICGTIVGVILFAVIVVVKIAMPH